MLPGMAESSPPVPATFDPRAVIEGRIPGRTSVAFIVGIVITAVCAIVALGIDVLQSFAAGDQSRMLVIGHGSLLQALDAGGRQPPCGWGHHG